MSPPTMQQRKIAIRTLKCGESLIKPGQKLDSLYVLQSGRLSICHTKGERTVEIAQLNAPSCLAEEGLLAPVSWSLTALAVREAQVVEIPFELLNAQIQFLSPPAQVLFKAMLERTRATFADLKALRSNKEVAPCPSENVAKVFGVIFHSMKAVGSGDKDTMISDWGDLQRYAIEVFDESIGRFEDAINVLVKLSFAEIKGKQIEIRNLVQIEAFFDYYGNYYLKGGSSDLLRTNAKITRVTEEFMKIAERSRIDRGGNAHLPYKETIDSMKAALGKSFEADQLFRLEQKGLFIKRTTTQDGGILSFYKPDFEQMLINWKFLREIELWNEKGFVDMGAGVRGAESPQDPAGERKKWASLLAEWKSMAELGVLPKVRTGEKKAGEVWCSICLTPLKRAQKACPVCGAESQSSAA